MAHFVALQALAILVPRYWVLGRRLHSPGRIGAGGVINEENPASVRQPSVHLHAVMVDNHCVAGLVLAFDQPLRASHGEIARNGRMVGDHVHVRLHPDIRCHGLANSVSAPSSSGFAMDLVDLHDRGFRVIHCGSSLDILRVEGACEPQIA